MIRFFLLVIVSSLIRGIASLSANGPLQHRITNAIPALERSNWNRKQVLKIFREEVFGIVPNVEDGGNTSFAIVSKNPKALGGRATLFVLEVTFSATEQDSFSFPVRLFVPNNKRPVSTSPSNQQEEKNDCHPVFLFLCNRSEEEILGEDENVSEYWPVEEIVASGFATAAVWAGDIDPDDQNDDFANGIHPILDQGDFVRNDRSWGAIAAWAWGLSRILDVLEQGSKIFQINPAKVCVIGHSRGGKTALWAAAQDERFAMAVSNNSGCTGAALSKRKACGKFGETVRQINTVFPNWFCKRYRSYNDREYSLLVDQHMLLALVAPRAISVASATEDDWADPTGEYISLREASKIWKDSPSLPKEQPPPEQPIDSGNIHYHLRSGPHDLNLYDWKQHMAAFQRYIDNQ